MGDEIRITPTDEIRAIHENLHNTLKRKSCYNLTALQRIFLVLSASKFIKVHGMNNPLSITNRTAFLKFQADWK